MKRQIGIALRMFLVLSILTGVLYPLFITFLAEIFFPFPSAGSLLEKDGTTIGSALIAQRFCSDRYFWPRPSSIAYQPFPSGGSNFGPTSAAFHDSTERRRHEFLVQNFLPPSGSVPPEMVSASGSGIDPHISPQAARAQVKRVAEARGLKGTAGQAVASLVERHVEPPQWGVFGAERVNVLSLNLALDSLSIELGRPLL